MVTRQHDIANVKKLKNGEECTIFWSEDGGGLVKKDQDVLHLYYVPQYGGDEQFYKSFPVGYAEELVDTAWCWT